MNMTWRKKDAHTWEHKAATVLANITKVRGGLPHVPFQWVAYPLPMNNFRDASGRVIPMGKGRSRTLTEAKAAAARAVARWHGERQ